MPDWEERAYCQTYPDAWHPDRGDRHVAVAACRSKCPVMAECGFKAAADGARWGVWGGEWLEGAAGREGRKRLREKAIAAGRPVAPIDLGAE